MLRYEPLTQQPVGNRCPYYYHALVYHLKKMENTEGLHTFHDVTCVTNQVLCYMSAKKKWIIAGINMYLNGLEINNVGYYDCQMNYMSFIQCIYSAFKFCNVINRRVIMCVIWMCMMSCYESYEIAMTRDEIMWFYYTS